MKKFKNDWNYVTDFILEMPKIGEKIIIDFGNGMGSNKKFPYQTESINAEVRGDFVVFSVEGRQLKKDGSFKNTYFQLLFTNKPKGHYGWCKEKGSTKEPSRGDWVNGEWVEDVNNIYGEDV